jgi:hypothetical protein
VCRALAAGITIAVVIDPHTGYAATVRDLLPAARLAVDHAHLVASSASFASRMSSSSLKMPLVPLMAAAKIHCERACQTINPFSSESPYISASVARVNRFRTIWVYRCWSSTFEFPSVMGGATGDRGLAYL